MLMHRFECTECEFILPLDDIPKSQRGKQYIIVKHDDCDNVAMVFKNNNIRIDLYVCSECGYFEFKKSPADSRVENIRIKKHDDIKRCNILDMKYLESNTYEKKNKLTKNKMEKVIKRIVNSWETDQIKVR